MSELVYLVPWFVLIASFLLWRAEKNAGTRLLLAGSWVVSVSALLSFLHARLRYAHLSPGDLLHENEDVAWLRELAFDLAPFGVVILLAGFVVYCVQKFVSRHGADKKV